MEKTSTTPLVNPRCVRVECIDRIRTAYIMSEDTPIATITEEYSSLSGESDWVITPIWENFDRKQKEHAFNHIAGIDDSLRKKEYIRNYVPPFVEQRVIPKGRADLPYFLRKMHLVSYDLFEMMCRSHALTGCNRLYVSRTPDKIVTGDNPVPDIPDFDTDCYGWLQEDGTPAPYGGKLPPDSWKDPYKYLDTAPNPMVGVY